MTPDMPGAPSASRFTCEGCGEDKPCPAGVAAEHVDGEVYLFCDENCATGWLRKVLVVDDVTEEIDTKASTARAHARRNARKN